MCGSRSPNESLSLAKKGEDFHEENYELKNYKILTFPCLTWYSWQRIFSKGEHF